MLDRKKDSLYVLVLQYETLYLYWWLLVAAPSSWRCGEAGIATMACTIRNIIMTLAVLECFPGKAIDNAKVSC